MGSTGPMKKWIVVRVVVELALLRRARHGGWWGAGPMMKGQHRSIQGVDL